MDKIKKDFVTEGAYRCKVISSFNSSQMKDYSSAPFISFELKTDDNKYGRAKFWTPRDSDKESTKEWKKKTLKDFLVNCGVSDFSDKEQTVKNAIDKYVNVCFVFEEYIGYDKITKEPTKRKAIRYRWSSKEGANIKYDAGYNKPLTSEQEQELAKAREQWKSSSVSQESNDDLPF